MANSIITNTAALAALATLRSIDSNLETSQSRISSGLRVGTAADDAAYWSIATTMRSDNAALATVSDALGLAGAKTDTAYAGLNSTIDILTKIKAKLTSAQESSVDKDKVQKEIAELKNQLQTIAMSTSFSSENWLYNSTTNAFGTKDMVGSFTRNSNGTVQIQTISFNTQNSCLLDLKDAQRGQLTKGININMPALGGASATSGTFTLIRLSGGLSFTGTEIIINAATTNQTLAGMASAVEAMQKSVTDVAGTLGAVQARIQTQSSFVKALQDSITEGIGRLVDADMNEESTRLKALQTQQQLGVQSLTIANNNAQQIMQLFRQ